MSRLHRRLAAVLLAAAAGCGNPGGLTKADLKSPSPERRAGAVALLASSDDEDDVPALLVAQHDPSAVVRKAAAAAFATRGGSRSADALGELLRDSDPDVVAAAAKGLGQMPKEKKAKDYLVATYWRASPQGRAEIASALSASGASLREAIEAEGKRLWERNLKALEGGRAAERNGAAEEIGRSGKAEAVQKLLPLVDLKKNDNVLLAAAAARGLGAAGDKSARPALVGLLAEDYPQVREAAAEALGALGDPEAAPALAKAGIGSSPTAAAAAIDALVALPQAPEVGLALCEIAEGTLDPELAARSAAAARAREAECQDKPLLAHLQRGGPDADAALAAIAGLGLPAARQKPFAEKALALFTAPATPARTKGLAARMLGSMGWTAAAPALQKQAKALSDALRAAREKWIDKPLTLDFAEGFSPQAGGALVHRRATAMADRLQEAADLAREKARKTEAAPDAGPPMLVQPPEPKKGASWLLSRFKEARPDLPEIVEDFDPAEAEELAAILVALARLKAEGAADLLTDLAGDRSEAIREGAVTALGIWGGEVAQTRLTQALQDPSPRVRSSAAVALVPLGAAAVPTLAEASTKGDPEARKALTRALGETGSPDAVPALARLLDDYTAPTAAQALGRLGVKGGVEPLRKHLEKPRAMGRIEAIDALGQLGDVSVGDRLQAELTSDRPEVRAAAARALGRLKLDGASQRLEALRSDYYGEVRRAAVEALAKLPAGAEATRR